MNKTFVTKMPNHIGAFIRRAAIREMDNAKYKK